MSRGFLVLSLSAVMMFTACAAIKEAHRKEVHQSLSFAPNADLADYGRIAMLPFECTGPLCESEDVTDMRDGSSMSLSRVGYDVYAYDRFEQLMARSYQTVIVEETTTTTTTTDAKPVGMSMSMTGDEMGGSVSASVTDPETGETISVSVGADFSGAHASISADETTTKHTTVTRTVPSVIVYDELPSHAQAWVLEESGINGVVTGRVSVSEPNEVTGFVTVRTFVRMGDARTGQMVWQFEWEDNAHDGRVDVPEAINRTVEALEEAHRMHMGMESRTL